MATKDRHEVIRKATAACGAAARMSSTGNPFLRADFDALEYVRSNFIAYGIVQDFHPRLWKQS